MSDDGEAAARAAADRVARNSYGKLVAFLASRTGDLAGAEDALSEAFAAALVDWPIHGVPRSPDAWLLTVSRRRQIDALRRRRSRVEAAEHIQLLADELTAAAAHPGDIPDERLALMFACAHPAIAPSIRAPLILQTVLGFDAAAIASAFLVSPGTMAQRLVRAKNKIRLAGIPFRVPDRGELGPRMGAVLEAVYAAFTAGWSDPSGTDARRHVLAEEGIYLGRLLVALVPDEPEVLGLLALMLHADARHSARRDSEGQYVPLAEQDPSLWDAAMIDEAEALLRHANAMPGLGRFQLEAAVQSAHVVRRCAGHADWVAIEALYDALLQMTDSPVVAINRAVAVAETRGAATALAELPELAETPQLADYQPYWAARAGLLAQIGQIDAADAAYERAIGLEVDDAVRRFLQGRRAALRPQPRTS